jgi:hypothetical protein
MGSKSWLKFLFIAAVVALLWPQAGAQSAHKTGPHYNAASEVKIKGIIEEIREVPGEFEGTHLVVKTETKTFLVHCAPSAFLKEIDASFAKGDQVLIVGAQAPDAPEEILAREITDGNNTVTLRDDKGVPIWAGWKPSKVAGK